jgi:hypothetical protein
LCLLSRITASLGLTLVDQSGGFRVNLLQD